MLKKNGYNHKGLRRLDKNRQTRKHFDQVWQTKKSNGKTDTKPNRQTNKRDRMEGDNVTHNKTMGHKANKQRQTEWRR